MNKANNKKKYTFIIFGTGFLINIANAAPDPDLNVTESASKRKITTQSHITKLNAKNSVFGDTSHRHPEQGNEERFTDDIEQDIDTDEGFEQRIDTAYAAEEGYSSNLLSHDNAWKILDNYEYISPYNYLQNPFALISGNSRTDKNGALDVGLSGMARENIMSSDTNPNTWGSGWVSEVWGQSPRWAGFAVGGAFTVSNLGTVDLTNPSGVNRQKAVVTAQLGTPSQAYVDYQFSSIVDVAAGNIVLNTPWMLSQLNNPYFLDSTYQGAVVNIKPLDSLLITALGITGFQMYSNNWWTPTTLYNQLNSMTPSLNGSQYSTPGAFALGGRYTPTPNYDLNIWFYQFTNYADMLYADTQYTVNFTDTVNMQFGVQALAQRAQGTDIMSQQTLADGAPAGSPGGNAYGLQFAVNTKYDSVTIGYNQLFGDSNSFLHGGIITPYTYQFEYDPLYTSASIWSMAELGSGNAFAIQNSLHFFNNSLAIIGRYSNYNINQAYSTQVGYAQEWDAIVNYSIPHTGFITQSRLVYAQEGTNSGPNILQPRVIVSYVF